MKLKLFFVCALLALCSCNSTGQRRPKQSPPKTNAFTGASDAIQPVPEKTYTGLQPGDISPDAVKIDVDNIKAIINGACIIVKGKLEAMIDLKGNFLVPWGKYQYYVDETRPNYSTLIHVSDPVGTAHGYINTRGQVVIPLVYYKAGDFDVYKIASVGTIHGSFNIDNHGRELPEYYYTPIWWDNLSERNLYDRPQADNFLRTDITERNAPGTAPSQNRATFIDRYGKITIHQKYYQTGAFSEGMCAVAAIDQFNVVRWGYINEAGKLVIPFKYIIRPGNFHNGLALVVPQEKTDFDFAYIDKSDNIKFKITHSEYYPSFNGVLSAEAPHNPNVARMVVNGDFFNGFAYWKGWGDEVVLLDTAGQFHKFHEIVKDPLIANSPGGLSMFKHDDLGIYYKIIRKGTTSANTVGLVDYNGNTIFPPAFSWLTPDLYSPYAYATVLPVNAPYPTAADKRNISGIVNRQGVFVLVLAKKPVF